MSYFGSDVRKHRVMDRNGEDAEGSGRHARAQSLDFEEDARHLIGIARVAI